MTDRPIIYAWDGESFTPANQHWAKEADRQYVVGERYALVRHEERSAATHRHAFAWLHEAWRQLPEKLAEQFPTSEHLRKKGLIECGYFHETMVDAGSQAAALRIAAFMRADDDFAHIVTRGPFVVKRVAKSQSHRAMNKKEFQESKTALMDWVSALVKIEPAVLIGNAGRAA
jgi:hypothetical protein